MAYVIIKMTPAGMKKHGGKGNNRETEWTQQLNHATPEQRAAMTVNHIGMDNGGLDCIVLGDYAPGSILGIPYIVPRYYDEPLTDTDIHAQLAIMADQYPAALAQSTQLAALPPRNQKLIKPIETDTNDE